MKAVLVVLSLLFGVAEAAAQDRVPLVVESAGGARHDFRVEIADTDPARAQGLMHRRELAPDHGMLFVFDRHHTITMWMKNAPLPLDMIFIGSDGTVVDLHRRAVPFSLDTIASKRRARYVLEVNGGTVDRLGLAVGDRVSGAGIGG